MRKQIIILITGGIGSGKSTVCSIFELLGIPVYYSDERAKWILDHSDLVKRKIALKFGNELILATGKVDKIRLAETVFTNEESLNFLNNLIHPLVQKDFMQWKSKQESELLMIESALLNKTNSAYSIDKQIIVLADEPLRMDRVMKRDSVDKEKVQNRMRRQPQIEHCVQDSDFIIQNNGNHSLVRQSLAIFNKLKSEFPAKC